MLSGAWCRSDHQLAINLLFPPIPFLSLSEDGRVRQNSAQASRLLREALEAGRIRAVDPTAETKLMRYLPYWA